MNLEVLERVGRAENRCFLDDIEMFLTPLTFILKRGIFAFFVLLLGCFGFEGLLLI